MPTVTVIQPTIAEEKAVKIRCAAYCRVSSDSEDQLNSFMAQTRYYSQVFEDSETEELIDIYADEGITGTREDKRDEFQRMLKDCRKGKIDRIYTKSISRFARNTRDCLKNVRELKSLGITIYFSFVSTYRTTFLFQGSPFEFFGILPALRSLLIRRSPFPFKKSSYMRFTISASLGFTIIFPPDFVYPYGTWDTIYVPLAIRFLMLHCIF